MTGGSKTRMTFGIMCLAVLLSLPFIPFVKTYVAIPNEVVTFQDSQLDIPVFSSENSKVNSSSTQGEFDQSVFLATNTKSNEIIYEYAGVPLKKVDLEVLDDFKVIPGGQSLGVQLNTLGVLVVGHYLVSQPDGKVSPGEDANVKVGDIILKVNGKSIKNMEEVKPFVDEAGKNDKELALTIKRGKKTINTSLKPATDKKKDNYQIGLYIRDSAAGIGTMTFQDPKSKRYGALGHVISDMDTKKPIEINDGKIVRSSVTSIEKGDNGNPGEKQANFSVEDKQLGSITKNSPFGIFGRLNGIIENNRMDKPMPISLSHEVKEGPAKILTVVEKEKVEEFDVEIVSSVPQKFPATKGMVIKITDPKLLKATGGIVQGMSGSPIIQNGKVIGAVTHVFINDPTSGYGVHIEWMLQEAGIDIYKKKLEEAS